jgi:hypothetical protein
VLHQVGVGVLGPVYRTYEPDRDRLVAVKVFRLDITPEQARTLADELNYLVSLGLSHPAIVTPLSAGVEGTVPFFAQDYVAAESLDVAMRHIAPAPIEKALVLIRQIADAIDAARAAGVLHGSLHPRDIFVTPDQVRITGFGVASAIEQLGLRAPIRRPYSAPERVAGQPWRAPADIYSLAAIAHELLTGRRVAGPGDRAAAILARVKLKHLQDVFVQALAEEPGARYSSAAGFMAALTRGSAEPHLVFDETDEILAGAWTEARDARADSSGEAEAERGDSGDLPLRLSGVDDAHRLPSVSVSPRGEWRDVDSPPQVEARGVPPFEEEDGGRAQDERSMPLRHRDDVPPGGESDGGRLRPEPDGRDARPGGFIDTRWDLGDADPDVDTRFPSEASAEAVSSERLQPGSLDSESAGARDEDRAAGVLEGTAAAPPARLLGIGELPPAAFDAEAAADGRFEVSPDASREIEPFADEQRSADGPPLLTYPSAERSRPHMLPYALTTTVGLLVGFLVGYSLNPREAATPGAPAVADMAAQAGSPSPPPAFERADLALGDVGTDGPGVRRGAPPSPPPTVPEDVPAPLETSAPPQPPAREQAGRSTPPPAPGRALDTRAPAAGRSAAPAPQPARAAEGRILVRSSPGGAVVRINNVERGATPVAVRELAYGSYTVQVSLPGYAPQSRRVTISAQRPAASFEFTMQPVRARVDEPAAPTGTRPTSTAERRAVPASAPATEPAAAGRPGSLFIDSQPRGAWVFIGDRSIGTTPMLLSEIRAGVHDVRIEHEGYQAWTSGVRIAPGERQNVTASLRPQP